MARVKFTPAQRTAAEEALANGRELEAQLVEAVEAGLESEPELVRIRVLVGRIENSLKIFG